MDYTPHGRSRQTQSNEASETRSYLTYIGRSAARTPRYVRNAVLAGYDIAAGSSGLDPARILQQTNLSSDRAAPSNSLISLHSFLELLTLSASLSGCRDFGTRMAAANGIPDLGAVSLLMREAKDVEGALHTMEAYIGLHTDGLEISIEKKFDDPFIGFNVYSRSAEEAFQAGQFWLAGMVLNLRWLLGRDFAPISVSVPCSRPLSTPAANRLFGCPITNEGRSYGLVISRNLLIQPLATSCSFLREEALQHLMQIIRPPSPSFTAVVTRVVRRRLNAGGCSSENVSRELGLDRRTMNRRLQPEKQTFSSILQKAREDVILDYFKAGHSTLAELTDAAGFDSQSAFCRWFQLSFGGTVTEMRCKLAHGLVTDDIKS